MQDIYVVFLASGYKVGQLIRFFTRGTYNHVALSLTESPEVMYSFARKNYFEPLNGGFVEETPRRYFFSGRDAQVKICRLRVPQDQYQRILAALEQFRSQAEQTRYDFLSLMLYPLRRQLHLPNSFTCIGFVLSLLEQPDFLSIGQLEQRLSPETVYCGSLRRCTRTRPVKNDPYFSRQHSTLQIWLGAGSALGGLLFSAGRDFGRWLRQRRC